MEDRRTQFFSDSGMVSLNHAVDQAWCAVSSALSAGPSCFSGLAQGKAVAVNDDFLHFDGANDSCTGQGG